MTLALESNGVRSATNISEGAGMGEYSDGWGNLRAGECFDEVVREGEER
jgi:hypothetical protein